MRDILQYRGFRIKSSLTPGDTEALVDCVLDRQFQITTELKNNKHNLIYRMKTPDCEDLVLKVPLSRNNRRWERFLTLFRSGEALRIHQSHCQLKALGFNCPIAILAAEKRTAGMVTDSFLLYEYAMGTPATANKAAIVSRELQRLHATGYTRGDPKASNFLVDEDQVIFIDFRLARPRLFRKTAFRMEYAHFLHTMPEGIDFLETEEKRSLGFRFAAWLRMTISRLKRLKRRLRGF